MTFSRTLTLERAVFAALMGSCGLSASSRLFAPPGDRRPAPAAPRLQPTRPRPPAPPETSRGLRHDDGPAEVRRQELRQPLPQPLYRRLQPAPAHASPEQHRRPPLLVPGLTP